jgi:hypothetical protein
LVPSQPDEPAPVADAPSEPSALVSRLLRDSREELNRADSKAQILFGVFGIAYGVLLAAVVAGDWAPRNLCDGAEVVWWAGAALFTGGLACLMWVVWPRIAHAAGREKLAFFAHAAAYKTLPEFKQAVAARERELGADAVREREMDQAWNVSRIVTDKYKRIRWAMALLAAGSVGLLIAVVADLITQ